MRMRNPQMRVVRNPDAQQPPPEPPIPWKLIAITTAISGVETATCLAKLRKEGIVK